MSKKRLALILGNCLFPSHASLKPGANTLFFMAEDADLCTHFNYHKHKITLFLSAMRSHRDFIQRSYPVKYWSLDRSNMKLAFEEKLKKTLREHRIKNIVTYDIEDHFFRERIRTFCNREQITLEIVDSPGFATTHSEFLQYRKSYKRLFMNDFYIWQRQRLNVLLEGWRPLGGRWSFDRENRQRLPRDITIPLLPKLRRTSHTRDVALLVDELFPNHPGSIDSFYLPTTRTQAVRWYEAFLRERLNNFGPYEDAIAADQAFLFHSILSPVLNLGLLTPREVIGAVLKQKDIPLPSLEGFIRQIIGWREFMRGVYNTERLQGNFFTHTRKLSRAWYEGTTGLLPLDTVIRRIQKNAYAHHIERLMIVSNIMLLCEIHPDEVYRWFMEFFVDSSDWVMVPNVYGMGQFADGGSFATKPYISGSSYILKMSDFPKGAWCDVIDGLYWRFIGKHRRFFLKNPRMSMMVKAFDRLNPERRKAILQLAERFIKTKTE
ncbi:MAG: cryptochrome/photolyase family protein [Gemmatimonadota bacterium]|nr:MAG: cryptochrome/photolyase family protein [Gemmatimonadota bacterium]